MAFTKEHYRERVAWGDLFWGHSIDGGENEGTEPKGRQRTAKQQGDNENKKYVKRDSDSILNYEQLKVYINDRIWDCGLFY